MNGSINERNGPAGDATVAMFDRLEDALARIAAAARRQVPSADPERAPEVTERLDALIAELRRALSGEQS